MMQLIVILALAGVLGCSRELPAPTSSAAPNEAHRAPGEAASVGARRTGRWARVITAGPDTTLFGVASGGAGTFAVVTRRAGAGVEVDGGRVAAPSAVAGYGLLQFDAAGDPQDGRGIEVVYTSDPPPLAVGAQDMVIGLNQVRSDLGTGAPAEAYGTIATFRSAARASRTQGVPWELEQLVRTSSGASWVLGLPQPLPEGSSLQRCVVRFHATGREDARVCGERWNSMRLAGLGEDAVVCGSHAFRTVAVGGKTAPDGATFVARVAPDGTARWVRTVNEFGDSLCTDIVVTTDGDVVLAGRANEVADFTEDARARGLTPRSAQTIDAAAVTRVWLARYAGDGTRRWVKTIGEAFPGLAVPLAADRDGNVVVGGAFVLPVNFGEGAVGPADGALLVLSVDVRGRLRGMLQIDGAYSPVLAVDADDGLLLGLTAKQRVTLGDQVIEVPGDAAIVARVPLPLPPPPPPRTP